MEYQKQARRGGGDSLELVAGDRPFDLSATAWLVGQGVRYLHTADEEGKLAYQRVMELLGGRKDAVETITRLIQRVPLGDVPLRWSLLYLLGEVADKTAAGFLARLSIEPLPAEEGKGGCAGPRDGELLVRTMAVEALQRIAVRHPDTVEYLLKIVSEHPARPILIEAVKAAADLGLKEKVRELLSKEDHWILDIRRARIEEIGAEPKRRDTNERGFTPPKMPSRYTAPSAVCHTHQED